MRGRVFAVALLAGMACAHAQYSQPVHFDPLACPLIETSEDRREYTVYLTDGSVLKGTSTLCRRFLQPAVTVKIDGRAVAPGETDSLVVGGITALPGPDALSWAFRVRAGRISLYALRPEDSAKRPAYMKKEGGAMLKYSLRGLEDLMRDNPRAAAYLRQKRKAGYLGIGLVVGGLGMAGIGTVASMKEGEDEYGEKTMRFEPSPLIFLGIGMMLASWIPEIVTADNEAKALALYNGGS